MIFLLAKRGKSKSKLHHKIRAKNLSYKSAVHTGGTHSPISRIVLAKMQTWNLGGNASQV